MSFSREQKNLAFILFIIAIVVMVAVKVSMALIHDPVADKLKKDQVVKVLFVIQGEDGTALCSEVFLYYPDSKKCAVIDIPGNTGAIWRSLGRVDRIDVIYRDRGMDAYRAEIEELLGLELPFSISIGQDEFGRMADYLGGLSVFIPEPVDRSDGDGGRWLLPSGAVTLDGEKLRDYMEFLMDDEDEEDRDARRLSAFGAFLTELKVSRTDVLDKKNFPFYSSCMHGNVDVDGLYELLEVISDFDTNFLTTQSVLGSERLVDGQKLIFPFLNGQLVKDVVKQKLRMLITQDTQDNRRVYVVEVLNGTYQQGLARNASILLENAGYSILRVGNADRMDYEHTAIINHIGNEAAVRTLGDFISCYNIIDEAIDLGSEGDEDVDFTLVLGGDWDGRYVRGGFGKEDAESKE
ncbi:MAG: LCP family protein [Treponema sp.]|nr:LCP family protein [Treponema sp.]